MRNPLRQYWHPFPELDAFDDATCRQFVRASRTRFIGRRALHAAISLPVILAVCVGVITLVGYSAMYLLQLEIINAGVLGTVMRPLLLALAMSLPIGTLCAALLVIRDRDVRFRIRLLLRRSGACRGCSYKLLGLAVSDAMTVTCPECGAVTRVDPALTALSGKARGGGALRILAKENAAMIGAGGRLLPAWITWRVAGRLTLGGGTALALILAPAVYILWEPMTQPYVTDVNLHSQRARILEIQRRIDQLFQYDNNRDDRDLLWKASTPLVYALDKHLPAHESESQVTSAPRNPIFRPTEYARSAALVAQSQVFWRGTADASTLTIDASDARDAVQLAITKSIPVIDDATMHILSLVSVDPNTRRTIALFGSSGYERNDNRETLDLLHALCRHESFALDQPRGITAMYALLIRPLSDLPWNYLYALSQRASVLALIRESLTTRPIDAASLRVLAAYIEETALPDAPDVVEWSYLTALFDSFTKYTDDGHGEGYRHIYGQYNDTSNIPRYSPHQLKAVRNIVIRYDSLFWPRRREVEANLMRIYDELVSLMSNRPAERDPMVLGRTNAIEELQRLGLAFSAYYYVLPSDGSASPYATFLALTDRAAILEAGTRTMLAIELHRADHGRYPESLDQLDSRVRWLLRDDPTTGRPFVYKRLDTDPLNAGRPYTLYALDANGVDHGGTPFFTSDGYQALLFAAEALPGADPVVIKSGQGTNFVFNLPIGWQPPAAATVPSQEQPNTTQTPSDAPQ